MPWLKWKTGMKTDAEIRQAGMQALIEALGAIETERFLAALSRDRFDYTAWRQSGLPDLDINTLSDLATRYSATLDH